MIIDGSYGEGGGQIVRSAIALSCILGKEVKIVNIRKGRKNPGLKNQHLHGIRLAARMCNARVEGLKIGSTRVKFIPSDVRGGVYEVNIGTAGSISLILQVAIPIMLHSGEDFTLRIRGGTDVPFSPPIDYYAYVLLPLIQRMGAKIEIEIVERGYYLQGGGLVVLHVQGSDLRPLEILERGNLVARRGYINLRNLPRHVCDRMKRVARDFEVIEDVRNSGISRGCGILLVEEYEKTLLSGDSLCRKGIPAERVAEMAMKNLGEERELGGTVDRHMADHLPVFAFLGGEVKYVVGKMTNHARTNLWLVEKFGAKVKVEGKKVEVQAYI